ncbi:expressed unknown protein [Seminavis robusta]|uniref:Calcineurin-like phosphoesterase domain-containing protein n=1 Tax=Seminavis robusta TaxID=568900 RepID=A0A9N8HTA7_9STRA|nr:expressed unknown protein [Seminavis robusta]|eukprot:Sro1489_g276990.1 n/a (632) ;mRNA; f:22649-24544
MLHSLPSQSSRCFLLLARRRSLHPWKRPRRFLCGTTNPPKKKVSCTIVSYLTDIEGDGSYLDRYVEQSRVLQFVPTDPRNTNNPISHNKNFSSCAYFPYDRCLDFGDDRGMLIFGGDIWDKGGSDLYVIRQLLDFKRRYPDRVHLIMGNRDINKMRIHQEMGSNNQEDLPPHDGVYWLRNHLQSTNAGDESSIVPSQTSASERLQFLLGRTMGSPNAFESRRLELQRERQLVADKNNTTISISDRDVVQSYRESCHPVTGEMGNYLANATLAFSLGALFVVHGALPLTNPVLQQQIIKEEAESSHNQQSADCWKDLSFAMPWTSESGSQEASPSSSITTAKKAIHDWVDALNQFARESIDAWQQEADNDPPEEKGSVWATNGGYSKEFPAYKLTQYGMGWTPDGKRNPTVVYSSWAVDGMPLRFVPGDDNKEDSLFARLVREFFRQSNIKLILSGHQPQGDMPLPIRIFEETQSTTRGHGEDEQLQLGWVLCCDTSYSGDTNWVNRDRQNMGRGRGPGFRGDVAVAETLVTIDNEGRLQDVRWHGVLCDGTLYETENLLSSSSCAPSVGYLADGDWLPDQDGTPHETPWWTKALMADGSVLLSTAKGYDVSNYMAKPHQSQGPAEEAPSQK